MGSCSLLQGIFPTQGSNPGLPHCRWSLYQLTYKDQKMFSRCLLNKHLVVQEAGLSGEGGAWTGARFSWKWGRAEWLGGGACWLWAGLDGGGVGLSELEVGLGRGGRGQLGWAGRVELDEGGGWRMQCASQFSSAAQSCPTLCNPMNCSAPGLPVHHQCPEFTQTHAH